MHPKWLCHCSRGWKTWDASWELFATKWYWFMSCARCCVLCTCKVHPPFYAREAGTAPEILRLNQTDFIKKVKLALTDSDFPKLILEHKILFYCTRQSLFLTISWFPTKTALYVGRLCQVMPSLKITIRLPVDRNLLQQLESHVRKLLINERDRDVLAQLRVTVDELDR